MTADVTWHRALCAPGGKTYAALALLASGEHAGEIVEHPWLTFLKPGEVILMREPPALQPPFPVTFTEDRAPAAQPVEYCRVYWGSHGCDHPRGHGPEVPHECDCCTCENHPDPDPDNPNDESSCVARPPWYGPGTHFYGEDAEALGLPLAGDC